MTLLVVIPTESSTESLDKKITEMFGNLSYRLPRGEWLVAYGGTSKQLSDELGISSGEIGPGAVVLAFNGYWGRASTAVWEWIGSAQAKVP